MVLHVGMNRAVEAGQGLLLQRGEFPIALRPFGRSDIGATLRCSDGCGASPVGLDAHRGSGACERRTAHEDGGVRIAAADVAGVDRSSKILARVLEARDESRVGLRERALRADAHVVQAAHARDRARDVAGLVLGPGVGADVARKAHLVEVAALHQRRRLIREGGRGEPRPGVEAHRVLPQLQALVARAGQQEPHVVLAVQMHVRVAVQHVRERVRSDDGAEPAEVMALAVEDGGVAAHRPLTLRGRVTGLCHLHVVDRRGELERPALGCLRHMEPSFGR